MKIPPKKPHFFKPIQPGFKNGLKIPIGFLKYLKGHYQHGHVILKRAGKKWMVKLNEHRFEEGWEKFSEEHDVQLGYMLVFRHEGNMEFEVSIFDSTHCDREYVEYIQVEEKEKDGEEVDKEEEEEEGETSKKFEFDDKPNPCIMSSSRPFPNTEEVSTRFVFTVKPYCLTCGFLSFQRLPKKFVLANGYAKTCPLVIRDERQRSWNLRLASYGSGIHVLGGWNKFHLANGLKVGDRKMFEVVTNGEKPIWKFHDKPSPSIKSSNASFRPFVHSHFECDIRPYCLSYDILYIPKKFAHANDLINKKRDLIVRDERQRLWDLRLCYFGTGVCMKGGWHEFRYANCLKEGDRVMFEVVANGEKQIWQFHGKKGYDKNASIVQGND